MKTRHIWFFLDQAYGNIVPSLGIAMELMRRGHRISYVVTEDFAPLIRTVGATPVVIDFLKIRQTAVEELIVEDDHLNYRHTEEFQQQLVKELVARQTQHGLAQLASSYAARPPDLVVHDDSMDNTGRAWAGKLGIPKVRLATQFIDERHIDSYASDQVVVVTVPMFFQQPLERVTSDPRFRFVGFIPDARCIAFRPWRALSGSRPRVLISPTTGLLQQTSFCRKMVEIFRGQPWDVILSISGSHDKLSAFDPRVLGDLAENIHLNRAAGNFDILPNAQLFIGQAGQGGALEAIYWGLPQILLPPTRYHYSVAHRVQELGLGVCLPLAELSRETLIRHATRLLEDPETLQRVREARRLMRERSGSALAADILEAHCASA
jgi:UDP:flavonoid glycosyltransferase YjiC (YdhE family)